MGSIADPFFEREVTAPQVLFVDGACPHLLDASHTVSIIGSRTASPQARALAQSVARAAAGRGITVVSGYADGVDAAAHVGAMYEDGPTVAVLGCGIEAKEPSRSCLEQYISCNGVFVSEESDPALPSSLDSRRRRDRITAALSDALFVIADEADGGGVHTARIGHLLGKKVFAVDWNGIKEPESGRIGSDGLLRDGTAVAIEAQSADEQVARMLDERIWA